MYPVTATYPTLSRLARPTRNDKSVTINGPCDNFGTGAADVLQKCKAHRIAALCPYS